MINERLHAQLLAGPPATTALQVAEWLLAIQGQDPRGARLAIRARSAGLRFRDVDRAMTADRTLVTTWLNRGTLHVVSSEDYWWLHPLTTPALHTGNANRLRQEGVSPTAADKGVEVAERALAAEGPLTRRQLRERIAAAGVRVEGQALVHILVLASLRGLLVRGPVVGGEQAYALVRDWLGDPPPPLDHGVALGGLAQRYLAGHGPAGERDLARWAGIPITAARRAFASIAPRIEQRPDGLIDLAGRPKPASAGPPRLLGPFDPLLLGWASRAPVLGSHQNAVTVNGIFRPIALVRGKAVGTWRLTDGSVELTPFASLAPDETPDPDEVAALDEEAADVVRFLSQDGTDTRPDNPDPNPADSGAGAGADSASAAGPDRPNRRHRVTSASRREVP
ncbi:MAG: winged helix DNA-binding domain-containing protein [Frankiaceae bacterium]